jgi:DeoR family suf operon transcriptional repressor
MTTTQQHSKKQDILHYLLKQGQATAQELADQFQVSPQAIRRHLKDLEVEGLIAHEAIQLGMGRPNHVYTLSEIGHAQFPDRYGDFAVSLLGTLAETVGTDQMGSILRKQWERKALEYRDRLGQGSLKQRVASLVEIRKAEGYMAEYYPIAADGSLIEQAAAIEQSPGSMDASESRFILTEYNCAISHIAETFPSVCGHELEMFAAALPDCTVERTHWIVNQ